MSDLRRLVRHILLGTMAPYSWYAHAATPVSGTLPVACQAGLCGTQSSFVTSGTASAVVSGKNLTVTQSSNSATLNWASFNIAGDSKVTFVQPSTSAVALNRIYDANPTQIFGSLTANGQVYLINANGFLFGPTASVNVYGLIASSLNMTDGTFSNLLNPATKSLPALESFTTSNQNFSADSGAVLTNTGTITVAAGAQLNAADGGRLLLAGSQVINGGTLTAPDGQVILAGGQSVYLAASQNADLRGLVVEVDGGSSAASQLSSVINESTGSISTPRGNVTLAGLMINQDGRISATTTVNYNGSITLTAGTNPQDNAGTLAGERVGGTLTLGPDSDIEILPQLSDTTTAVDDQAQMPSTITLSAQKIYMHGGAIIAPSGTLDVTASSSPASAAAGLHGTDSAASIRIDAGTDIDLSGSDAVLPMDANLIQVQLRSDELADDPTQRDGALRGDTVTVDIRADDGSGTSIANLSSAIAAIGKNIAQRTETGGTVSILSGGDVVFSPGASINVSGGETTYQGGVIQTTKLIGANGKLYDIGSASSTMTYVGVVNPTYTTKYNYWGVTQVVPTAGLSTYEAGYVQGAAAGSVQFAAPSMVLQGTLKASSVTGPYQRALSGTGLLGGTLTVGIPGNVSSTDSNEYDYLAPAIDVVANPSPVVIADGTSLPSGTLQLPASYLTSDGFSQIKLASNSSFLLPAGEALQLAAGTSLQVDAARIDINSSITDLGGSLTFQSEPTIDEASYAASTSATSGTLMGVSLGDGVTLDVSGLWTNDEYGAGGAGTTPTLQDGGSITLQLTQTQGEPSELQLGNNVALRANGGAWLSSTGSLTYGKGGAITLDASPEPGGVLQVGANTTLSAFGVGTAAGGSFSLLAPRIELLPGTGAWTAPQHVDDSASSTATFDVFAPLLNADGFSNVSLTATGSAVSSTDTDILTVAPGSYTLQTRSLQLAQNYAANPTGGTVAGFSQTTLLPLYERPAANLTLAATRPADAATLNSLNYGTLDFEQGAVINADPAASIDLTGASSILFDGTINAPGGSVAMTLLAPEEFGYSEYLTVDPGDVVGLGITLGSDSVIDVSAGSVAYKPSQQNLLLGTVATGGTVSVIAERGSVSVDAGAQIDFAGTSALLDVYNSGSGRYTRETVGSAGGTVTLGAADSLQMLGTLHGAGGVGTTGAAAGGTLEIDLTNLVGDTLAASQPRVLNVVGDASGMAAPGSDQALIGLAQILQGTGVDALTLNVGSGDGEPGEILFSTNESLALGRSLTLEAQNISVASGVSASVSAPDVSIGNPLVQSVSASSLAAPTAGTGSLAVSSQLLTLVGNITVNGTSQLTLSSSGDVQLQGTHPQSASGPELGSLEATGHITLQGQRVYPDTDTSFAIAAVGGTGPTTVDIDGPASGQTSSTAPLSADGALNVSADRIEVGGSIFAPFGSVTLAANQSVQLSSGALISVSGAGLDIPYGETEANGATWVYNDPTANASGLSGTATTVAGSGTATTVSGVPGKSVTLSAPSLTVQSGAKVDLSGGGDLYSYEWVPGTGGSKDVLAGSGASGNVAGLYAIIPTQAGVAAAHDPEESGSLGTSQTVYLSGGAGIAAGYYSLLPARYALMPGAILIQVEPSYTSAKGGQIGSLTNGAAVIAGYFSSYGTTTSTGTTSYEGFAIYPSGYEQQLAAYTVSQASSYFSAAAKASGATSVALPADAGTLNLTVVAATNAAIGEALNLSGTVETSAAKGGRGAQINISAPDLEVSENGTVSSSGAVGVSASVLEGWSPSEITLGGVLSSDGSTATVAADHIAVDGGTSLSADQLYLMANDSIEVQSGALLASTSGSKGTVLATAPTAQSLSLSNSGAAFLGVSDVALAEVTRTGSSGSGSLSLDSGSTISTGGALALDAPGSIVAAGTISGSGASWSLASNSIAFAGSTGSTPDSLNINASLQQQMQTAGALRLASQGSLDFLAPVTLTGAASQDLTSVSLVAGSINNESGGSVTLAGGALSLAGVSTTTAAPTAGSGTFTLVGNSLNLVGNSTAINGFASTVWQIAGPVTSTAAGTATVAVGGDLTVNASELNPGAGATTTITATGAMQLGSATAAGSAATQVGGALSLQAASIIDNGAITAPAGVVSLNATGGDVQLGSGSVITVAGTLLQAADQSAAAPGGTISLQASGNVSLSSGSILNVSGEENAPAGRIQISAGGTATLAGQLEGQAGSSGTGGNFTLAANQLGGSFSSLASTLSSGGFTDAIAVQVEQGDLVLNSGGTLTSNSITLTADSGTVDIAGTLNAPSATTRGLIDLSGQSVVLESTAALHADGSGSAGLGGEIDLNATCGSCSITLNSGSVVTASGKGGMGDLVLRAPALTSGANAGDVAINLPGTGITGLGADLTHAGQVIIEPVLTYSTSSTTVSNDLPTDVQLASNFLTSNSSGISQRLVTPSSSQLGTTQATVEAGIELVDANAADNTLVLPGIDLSGYSTGANTGTPQVINVNVRAAGSVEVSGTISDGFVPDTVSGNGLLSLSNSPSASFSIVAGANTASANPLATLRGSSASLTLDSSSTPTDDTPDGVGPAVIRTGTGDINLAAAGNIVFATGSGTQYTASVYTGGMAPSTVVAPTYYSNTNILMNYGAGGGSVSLNAGGTVTGAAVGATDKTVDGGNYSVTGWLFYQGTSNDPAQYGVDYGAFDWNVGALGGGDVHVTAGSNITNLSAAVSDSYVAASNTTTQQASLYGAGGGLVMHAGGDIGSPAVYVADGSGVLTADGALSATRTYTHAGTSTPVGAELAIGNADLSVWVRNGLQVNAIYDPTLVPEIASDSELQGNGFITYGADSAVNLSTTTGTALLSLAPSPQNNALATLVGSASTQAYGYISPTLNVQALQGNLQLSDGGTVTMMPSSDGQLTLFAGQSIIANATSTIVMSDTALSTLPTVDNPENVFTPSAFSGVVHVDDSSPALITAGEDIDNLFLEVPKASQIVAGRDIVNLSYEGQNVNSNDVTLIAAGRDMTYTSANSFGVQVGGPGSVDVITGRNLNLGFSGGIVTTGTIRDPNLTDPTGASINLLVGYGTEGEDISGFIKSIIAPSATYQNELIAFVEALTGSSGLSFAQASTDFAALSSRQQMALVDVVFFNELLLSGRSANSGTGSGFAQGYAAIDALFPASRTSTSPYSGSLTLDFSQIYTDDGGDISILVPGGGINVGLATSPPGSPDKKPQQLGIVTEGSGNIDIYSLNDVNVNSSRIFTLGGGNILIWSTLGSIDAGNGSKSSLSVPPPTVSVSSTGVVSLNFGASVAGSGIRTIQTNSDESAGNVDLDAPVGTVDAGDAGIGASGNINIAAAHVVGVDNINFGGTATGVPSDVSSLGASLSGASSAAAGSTSSSTNSAQEGSTSQKEAAPIAQAALNWLDVFVTGLGEENCKQDDIDCLKRQRSAAP